MSALATATSTDPRTKTDAAITTKIELVTEAIEALVLATATSLATPKPRSHDDLTNENLLRALEISDARKGVADSLRALLQPTLRVTS